jgi:prenylcysteine oxidase/farnesylcysteine lyase
MRLFAVCVLLSGSSLAFQLPFKLPFFQAQDDAHQLVAPSDSKSPRVAIVGAGAAGSSAAFWISKAKERFGFEVEVDVFDRESYIGGRSTTVYPYNDTTNLKPIELGASIFVRTNKNLWRASDEFNLTRLDFEDEDSDMGIWDGQKFLLTTGGGGYLSDWWSTLKVLWRYGYTAPTRTRNIVKTMTAQFIQLYSPEAPRWDNISSLALSFEWTDMLSQSMAEYLDTHGVSPKFTREFVEAATRVNYGQDVDKIHALEGACSMAATGATSIQGGNFQIFEQFLLRSKAHLFLSTTVHSIKRNSDIPGHPSWTVRTDRGSEDYEAVIIAAPIHSTGISLPSAISSRIPKQPYVHLHVTLLATTSPRPNPEYFSLSPSSKVPSMVLTTYEGVRNGGKEPEFNSLSYHGYITKGVDGVPDQWSVKIFSKERISDEWLDKMFMGQVGWVYRKEWDAYPQLPPTTSFPPVKLDEGLYYVNAFEPFISTMETETIASRNVVDLLLNEAFATGICGPKLSSQDANETLTKDPADFVLGWDC